MANSRLDRWVRKLRCALTGHDKTWRTKGYFEPTWRCERCGAGGGLEEASRMPLGEHLVHLAIALVVFGLGWMLLRWIF